MLRLARSKSHLMFVMLALMAGCGGGGSGEGGGGVTATPASVAVTPTPVREYWGYDVQLSASARDAGGAAISPAPAFGWSSAAPDVASVGDTGLASLLRPGLVTVSASTSGVSGSATITVAGLGPLARAQEDTMCALDDQRERIFCWGAIGAPATPLITGTLTNGHALQPTPIGRGEIPAGTQITKVALALTTACAITSDGAAYCWGENDRGKLGVGTAEAGSPTPRRVAQGEVPAGVRFVDIAGSAWTFCAVGDDERLYCWGAHTTVPNPALSSTGFSSAPVAAAAGSLASANVRRIALSTNVGCALDDAGLAHCWKVGAIAPALVAQGARPAMARYTDLQIGDDLACALADNGEAYCWGSAFGHRFGAGSAAFVSNAAPTAVAAGARPNDVVWSRLSVGGGATSSCALGSDGRAYCWGKGYLGSLGDGDMADHVALTPAAVLDGEKAAAFSWHSLNCATYTCSALADDGRVYQWGGNQSLMLTRLNPPLVGSATPLMISRVVRP